MSGEGELPFDPTTTDTDGAGASAEGAVGGDSAGDTTLPPPLQPDATNPFEPTGATSTPYKTARDDYESIEMSNMDYNEYDDSMPLLEKIVSESDRETAIERTKRFIRDKLKVLIFLN